MTPLILLPGMMCDARLFAPQLDALGEGREIVCPPIHAHQSIRDIAASILATAPPRFALAGLSMGGIVAMEVLRQSPERIAALALMDTNPLAEKPEISAKRGPQMDAVRRGDLAKVMQEQHIPNYFAAATNSDPLAKLCLLHQSIHGVARSS